MSITELAEVAGVSNATISMWENGARSPRAGHLLAICQALGLQIEDVLLPADELEQRIRSIVDAAPPLTSAQRAKLAAILAPPQRRRPRTKAGT
jgi:transcriptional regulator with XRE-family HTH domain